MMSGVCVGKDSRVSLSIHSDNIPNVKKSNGGGIILKSIYGNNPWCLEESRYEPARAEQMASVFALANGFIGLRGGMDELCGMPQGGSTNELFLNGIYGSEPIRYAETAYGYAKNRQVMLGLANPLALRISVDGENLNCLGPKPPESKRTLDMRKGILARTSVWRLADGTEVKLTAERFVSVANRQLICSRFTLMANRPQAKLEMRSFISPSTLHDVQSEDSRCATVLSCPVTIRQNKARGAMCFATQRISQPAQYICTVSAHRIKSGDLRTEGFEVIASGNAALTLERFALIQPCGEFESGSVMQEQQNKAAAIASEGFEYALSQHSMVMAHRWLTGDVKIYGNLEMQQSIRFACFQLMGSADRKGLAGIPSKGLTGSGYDGHVFWDMDIFIIPYLLYTQPNTARELLVYRYRMLPSARSRAAELSLGRCALYPWRTINGAECSAYYPAGTAQYHINGDIAYAVNLYYTVTNDESFMFNYGVEILVETARLWMNLGFYNPKKGGRFCINCVTGPDEYTALVNNNCYTNLQARENLRNAALTVRQLRERFPELYDALCRRIQLEAGEPAAWDKAADKMYLPFDSERGLYLQDDEQEQRIPWPISDIPNGNFPLLLHYHPLLIYRHLICKQADVVMAMLLHPEFFSDREMDTALTYYDSITTHDSSLSRMAFSIQACRLNRMDMGNEYFVRSCSCDLNDDSGNTADGLHMANLGGLWMGLVYGYAGMHLRGNTLCFKPHIPELVNGYSFSLLFRGRKIDASIGREKADFSLAYGAPLTIICNDIPILLSAREKEPSTEKAVIFDLDGVLVSTDEMHYLAWKELCDDLGIPFDRQLNRAFRGVSRVDCVKLLEKWSGKTFSQEQANEYAERKNAIYRGMLSTLGPGSIAEDVIPTIKALRQRGYLIAVGSASKNTSYILNKLAIAEMFDVVIDGNAVTRSKPDPEVFLAAAGVLKLPAHKCIVVEDAADGALAGRRAGMPVVCIGEAAHTAQGIRNISRLSDLLSTGLI